MYHPEKLRLTNFMSHKNSEFTFTKGVATMVYGENISDEETESNGAGKSAILEGISVALMNAALRKASTKDLVMDGEKESIQELVLYNPILDIELVIKRTIFSNTKSGKLEIKVNGEDPNIDITNVDDGNKFILSTIGIGRDDLLNYFLISKEKYQPFLNISDTKKKAIIARFSQATLIDPVFADMDADIDRFSENIERLESEQKDIDSKIQVYQEEITNFSMKSVETARDNKVKQYREDILDYEEDILDHKELKKKEEGALDKLNNELATLKVSIGKLEEKNFKEEIDVLEKDILLILEDIEEEKKEYFKIAKIDTKIKKGLLDAVECPSCAHEFSISNDKLNVSVAKKRQKEVIAELKESSEWTKEQELKKAEKRIKVLEYEGILREQKKERVKIQDKIDNVVADISRKETKIGNIDKDILRVLEDIKSTKETIKQVKEKAIEDKRLEYKMQIKLLEESIANIVEESQKEISKKEAKSLLKETFVKFKSYLSNKAIGAIEANANEYLEKTKTDLSIQLDGYKVNRTGKIKENISVTMLRDGMPVGGGYGRLSSGEKVKVEISIIMSLQKLINNSTEHGKGLDLVWLDEIIESVDSRGISGIMKSLNATKQTIVAITHGTFNQVYPHTITVVKEDGISRVEED